MKKLVCIFVLAAVLRADYNCECRDYPNYEEFWLRPGNDSDYTYEYEYEEDNELADSEMLAEPLDTESTFEG